ncbi:MAG: hypothetical protein U0S36_14450 [Candidatus Nanopelagicales bacterium]
MSDLTPPSGDPVVPEPEQPAAATPPPPAPAEPTPPAAATPPPPPPPPAAAPTPPPPPPAAAVSPADGPWTLGNAFSYGWAKFQQYLGPILIAMLILFVIGAIISVVWFFIVGAITNSLYTPLEVKLDPETGQITTTGGGGPGFFVTLLLGALGALVYYTVFGFIQAAITRAALAITEGKKIESSTVLSTDRLGPVIVTALLYSIFTSIGYLFCGIGAVIVAFFLAYAFFFLLDQNLSPFDSIKASFNFVKDHVGDLILFYLASVVAYFVGAILCGIGLIVAIPVVIIATAYTYKKFTNQAVAA